MTYYGPKEIASSFRTVRANTLKIAEDIPEDKYSFSPAAGSRTVAQTLIHISNIHRFQLAIAKISTMVGFDFMALMGPLMAEEQKSYTKAEIIAKLKASGDEYASWIESLNEAVLGESVAMPPGGTPPARNRFDLIISVKEHEMHHRGQLMMAERIMGIVPHLTRAQQERMAAMQAAQK